LSIRTGVFFASEGENMNDGQFRKKKGFTAVQNAVAKNTDISLKAKGLYLLIQAFITMPGVSWKKSDFEKMCKEGTKAFNSAWDELKNKGYLHVHIYTENGVFRNEYELLDEAVSGPHTFYYNGKGDLSSTNEDRYPQNGINGNGSNGNGDNGNGMHGDGSNANGGNNNKTINIKQDNKTINNPSINPLENQEGQNDRWKYCAEFRKSNGKLPYDFILRDGSSKDEFINKLLEPCSKYGDSFKSTIIDTLSFAFREMLDAPTKIQGRFVDPITILSLIDKRMEKLIEPPWFGIVTTIDNTIAAYIKASQETVIKSKRDYLKSCFYSELVNGSLDIETQIAHDFGI